MTRRRAQHPDALEVVVVDGSSTDSTLAEVNDLKNSVTAVKFKCVRRAGTQRPPRGVADT